MANQQALLVEYQALIAAITASANRCWQSAALVAGAGLAAAAVVATRETSSKSTWEMLAVGVPIAVALLLVKLFLRREEWRDGEHWKRVREIERRLSLEAFSAIHEADRACQAKWWGPLRWAVFLLAPFAVWRMPSRKPFGWLFLYCLTGLGIYVWVALALVTAAQGLGLALGW